MGSAWAAGGTEAVAMAIATTDREANDPQLWAVVGDLATHLPASDQLAKALAGIKRTSGTIRALVGSAATQQKQLPMDELLVRGG